MSWLRQAVNKAVEVGKNKNNITRAVRTYAEQAGQAVAEGAKLIQDRIGALNYRSFKLSVKRLEEAAVSTRGQERTQVLMRWLILLKEIEKLSESSSEEKIKTLEDYLAPDEAKESTRKASMVLYYDSDEEGEPMNFKDVFLHSQALEGIMLSMILEAPTEEEVSLLLQIFEICLTGGKEVHNAIVSSIQDLAKAFSIYEDEVLVKREELLQFAQGAISGLKINGDLTRIDAEVSSLRQKLDEIRASSEVPADVSENDTTTMKLESLKKALAHIRACSRLEGLLLRKKLLHNGDTPEIHAQKVDKLKVLCASLANSSTKAEKRKSDTRFQREEALKFRVTKENDVGEVEKEITAEIAVLEKQRDELEAELKKVNISLAAAYKRLHNTKEEKFQFDEANEQIVSHLKTKEDELARSIDSCKVESDVLNTWINFLEDTWVLQCSYTEQKEKQANDDLEQHEDYFVNLTINLLSDYKKELQPGITRMRNFVENLKTLSQGYHDSGGDRTEMTSPGGDKDVDVSSPRKNLEEEYLNFEAKIITTFSFVDNMREQFYARQGKICRKDGSKVQELFDAVEKLRKEFETIERPTLEVESLETPGSEKLQENPPQSSLEQASDEPKDLKEENVDAESHSKLKAEQAGEKRERVEPSTKVKAEDQSPDHEAELAKLESEFGKLSPEYSAEDITGWEFDELEKELKG